MATGTGVWQPGVEAGMRRILALMAVVAVLVGCAKQGVGPGGSTGRDSGISGLVTLGPLCPVERADSPCPDKPIAARNQVKDAAGDVVATVSSGDDGRFAVSLAPGRYVLQGLAPTPGSPFPIGSTVTATVRPHRFTDVTVPFDTGIR
jgi:hypothetical protein